MKSSKKSLKTWLLLFLVLVFAFSLRILWLERVPIAISNDELDYILDAKSIFLSGRDISGQWSPLSLTTPPGQFPKAELPSLIISPFIGLAKLSLFNSRLPFVIWGVVLIASLFLITNKFLGRQVAFIVGLLAAINPWSIYFSRTAFDIPLSGVFYFIALYILIAFKSWKILIAFPFLFLAFFSYIGTKLIFLPFVLLNCFFSWFFINKRKHTPIYLIVILLSLFIFCWFLASPQTQLARSRINEILTPFHPEVSRRVDEERRLSTVTPLVNLFSNKPIIFTKLFLEKYLGIFSVDFLFLHGEGRATYSVWHHGLFYYLDLIFLVLGFWFIFTRKRQFWFILVALILIAPLPAALSTVGIEYALRGILLYPTLIIFIGAGVWFFLSSLKKRFYRFGFVGLVGLLYLIQLLNFLNIYFFRNPVYNSEGFGFSHRVLINYINLTKSMTNQVVVISDSPYDLFKKYLFYSQALSKGNLAKIRTMIAKKEYFWDNVNFIKDSPLKEGFNRGDLIILRADSAGLDWKKYPDWLTIAQLSDGGEIYRIINDSLCQQFELGRYPTEIKFSDFEVEKLSPERFCQKFISDLTGYSQIRPE